MNAMPPIRLLIAIPALAALAAVGLMPSGHFTSATMPPLAAIAASCQSSQQHAPQPGSSHNASALMCTSASCGGILGVPTGYMLLNVRLASFWVAPYPLGDGRLLIGPDPFPPKFLHTT